MGDKICGYLDQNGNYHKTKFECSNSNLDIRVRNLKDSINRLNTSYAMKFRQRYENEKIRVKPNISNVIEGMFVVMLVNQRNLFKEYIKEIEEIEKLHDELLQIKGLPRIFRRDWWKREIIEF